MAFDSRLKPHFTDCFHVDHIGLSIPLKDNEIWDYALENDLIIVTNDEDFLNLANVKGFQPKVILLKTFNQSKNFIEALLIKHKDDIQWLSQTNDYGILELY